MGLVFSLIVSLVFVFPVLAQNGDSLVECIEEVKQIREKEGGKWYEKNKTSCLGERAVGVWSVLELPEYDRKEAVNDMNLEFFAFFDVPVAGPEARKEQMKFAETKKLDEPGRGWRVAKRVEYLGVGDKSQLWLETREGDIAIANNRPDLASVWASDLIYGELMVVTGDCSFLVGGTAGKGPSWSSNHYLPLNDNAIVNTNHDHGEAILEKRLVEYAEEVVGRVAGACGGKNVAVKKTVQKSEEISRWIEENLNETTSEWIEKTSRDYELFGRTPQMTDEASFPREWQVKIAAQLTPGAKIISSDGYTVIIRADGGSVLYYPGALGVYVIENVHNLESGELEVRTETAPIDIKTINAFIKSKGTHYRVAYDVSKRLTRVEIYKGEVEITTMDGKKMTLVSGADKPVMVVIGNGFVWWKLGLLGVLAIVISGVIIFRRRSA